MSNLTLLGRIVLIGVLLVKMWVAPLLFLDYEIRKEYIIQNYCVNKNRPELHCDGKCYLAQRMQASQAQDEQQATDQFLRTFFMADQWVQENLFYDVTPEILVLGDAVLFPRIGLHTPDAPILSLLLPPKLSIF